MCKKITNLEIKTPIYSFGGSTNNVNKQDFDDSILFIGKPCECYEEKIRQDERKECAEIAEEESRYYRELGFLERDEASETARTIAEKIRNK